MCVCVCTKERDGERVCRRGVAWDKSRIGGNTKRGHADEENRRSADKVISDLAIQESATGNSDQCCGSDGGNYECKVVTSSILRTLRLGRKVSGKVLVEVYKVRNIRYRNEGSIQATVG